jgi:hypothetical protein
MTSIANGEGGLSVRTKLNTALAVTDAVSFATRAAFVSANTANPGIGLSDGQIAVAGGYAYRRLAASSAIADLAGWVPNGSPTPYHFGAAGNDVTNDTAAFQAFRNYHNANAGLSRIPAGDYVVTSDIVFSVNGGRVVGDGSTSTIIRGGARIAYAKCFDFELSGFTVLSSTGDAISIGEDTGTQTYAAWFKAFDLKTNFSGARGIVIGMAYMGEIFGLRAQNSVGIGIDMSSGLKTSLSVRNSHALDSDTDGWKIKNACYCTFTDLGADRNAGYGFALQNLSQVTLTMGAEDSTKAALWFYHDTATADIIKGFSAVTVSCFEKDNNSSAGATGSFAHFTASSGPAVAGTVTFDGCTHFTPPAGNSIQIDSGNYRIVMPRSRNSIKRAVGGGSFSVMADGANDYPNGLPVNITGAATPIATLRSKLTNGVSAFGGRLTVYVTNNSLSSGARSATYELLVTRAVGTSGITLIAATGNTTGATTDSASFTFGFNLTTNNLEATPVGSTATGNWYFHITASGNIDAEPL